MRKLIYASNMSLDGCTEDASGAFDWAPPDEEVFVAITEVMRRAGTYLYGRRMYETLAVWESDGALADTSDLTREYARVWQAAEKVVYSTTLTDVSTTRTRLERSFKPGVVRKLVSFRQVHLDLPAALPYAPESNLKSKELASVSPHQP